jgi:hypothetical protein
VGCRAQSVFHYTFLRDRRSLEMKIDDLDSKLSPFSDGTIGDNERETYAQLVGAHHRSRSVEEEEMSTGNRAA